MITTYKPSLKRETNTERDAYFRKKLGSGVSRRGDRQA